MKIIKYRRQTTEYGEEMTELIKQLVEEIKETIPKRIYVVYKYDPRLIATSYIVHSVHKTKKGAFRELFGEEKDGELDRRYVFNEENGTEIKKTVVDMTIYE